MRVCRSRSATKRPPRTASAIEQAQKRGGRVIAVGTTFTRALEAAAAAQKGGGISASQGMTELRLGPQGILPSAMAS